MVSNIIYLGIADFIKLIQFSTLFAKFSEGVYSFFRVNGNYVSITYSLFIYSKWRQPKK